MTTDNTHTRRETTHTCTHNSHYEIFVKFHTKYKEACHVCMCVCEGIKWSLYKKLAAWFWLALPWLPACLVLALPLSLSLARLITSGLGAGAYNEALFVAQSLAPEWKQQENKHRVEGNAENVCVCVCHLIRMRRHNCKAADIKIIFTRTKVGAHNAWACQG